MSNRMRLLAALLLTGLMGCGAEGEHEEAEPEHDPSEATVTVRTQPARKGKLAETIEGLGRTEAIPDHLATLTPAVEGHVEAILVEQGQAVKKGQPIVELDKSVAMADLAEKEATRDGLKASLTLLKSLPRPEERRSNELAIEQAKVAVVRAKATADRLRPLLARHEAADATVFDAEQAVEQALLQQKAAEALLAVHDDRPATRGGRRGGSPNQDGGRFGRILQGAPRVPRHPRTDRRSARQSDLPPRSDALGRLADR